MISPRALLAFAPGLVLIVVGTAMGLSNSGSTTPSNTLVDASAVSASLADGGPGAAAAASSILENAPRVINAAVGLPNSDGTTRGNTSAGASAVSASPAQAGETRSSGGSATSPAGKPGAVAAARSTVENDTGTTGTTGTSPSGAAGTEDRAMKPTVAPAVRVGGTSAALAAPPRYDIPKICKQIAGTQGSVIAEMSHQACMDAEHSARRDLTRRWSSIPEAIRKDCGETERALGLAGSYAALQSCIRANITAAQWRKANPDGAAGGSEGPGSAGRSRGSSALRTSLE